MLEFKIMALPAKIGRPLLLTPELRDSIVETVKVVKYLSVAANANGINEKTAERWNKLGRVHEEKNHPEGDDCTTNCTEQEVAFRSFYTAIKKAKAESTKSNLEKIKTIAERANKWEGIAWIEERTDPAKFGLKTRTDHKHSGSINSVHTVLSLEQRQRMLKAANDALTLETTQDENGVFIPVQDES